MGKRYLIDSNILIGFTGNLLPELIHKSISDILDEDFNISFISKIEVLGYHSANEAWYNFINQAVIITPNDEIIEQTILIRKLSKIKIPDAIIAATAIVNDLILLTRNIDDFKNIKGLKFENPWLWKK